MKLDVELDDALDAFLLSNDLDATIAMCPQFTDELQELAAFKRIDEAMRDRDYTPEEEKALKEVAIRVVQKVLDEKRAEKK